MIPLIVLGWYGIGLISSMIAMKHMNAKLDRIFPQFAPHTNGTGEKLFMAFMGILGPMNALAVFVYCLIGD